MYLKLAIAALGFTVLNHGIAREITYFKDVQPVIEKKCVVCHACFDAPCQLVLTHADGFARGASKQPVYDGLRASAVEPTRLFVDAHSTKAWRDKAFFTVLPEGRHEEGASKTSILEHMLLMREGADVEPGSRLPEETGFGLKRNNTCPSADEIIDYRENFPDGGMPLGVRGLTAAERQILLQWIAQGARFEPSPVRFSASESKSVRVWEAFLNQTSPRARLVARWLYEHLFMAHLYFKGVDSGHFFQIVRSRTAPGEAVDVIATRRPNDDPGQPFFYRLQVVADTIVQKTHIPFGLDKDLLSHIEFSFLDQSWTLEQLPGYADSDRANPFQTFAQIPPAARYRFMLDHAEFFVQTFIRGPVCHGQIATDVIRDRFWVMFQAPHSDLYVTSAQYRKQVTPSMDIAGVEQDLLEGAKTWFSVKQRYDDYNRLRRAAYERPETPNPGWSDIWDGNDENGNSLLTVFRHHDNASVRKGLIGDLPLTVWWMDYPLLERGYYNLVVNFDVFGSVAHQMQTRLYFDLIRNDAERNFLRLMPAQARQGLIDDWYEGAAQLKLMTAYQRVSDKKPPAIEYRSDDPQREFLRRLLDDFSHVNARPDRINRRPRTGTGQLQDTRFGADVVAAFRRFAAKPARELRAVEFFPEVSFVRLFDRHGRREIYTVIRDRRHSNVAFMLGESLRYEPEHDTLTVYPGVLASYPNFMFNVNVDDIDDFVEALLAVEDSQTFERTVVRQWGVRRSHQQFWQLFHDVSTYLEERDPVDAGVMDMSRYLNL